MPIGIRSSQFSSCQVGLCFLGRRRQGRIIGTGWFMTGYSAFTMERAQRTIRLTKREIEVLGLIAQGCSSKEAADALVVSKRTVDFHLANIYDKLQVNNRVQAFRAATRLGLIPFEPTMGLGRD